MKNTNIYFITYFFFTQLNADEIKCTTYNRNTSISAIENLATDCALQKNLAQDKNVQKQHREKVYDKLSNELAKQITQNSEDISLLTSFYNSNGQDLMMNSKEVAESCRLDTIKSIETCGGEKTGPYHDIKLSLLKNKLPSNKNTPFKNDQSLYALMAGKFYSDLGMSELANDIKCPLEGNSGNFMLRNQLDDSTSDKIVDLIRSSKDSVFDKFAHLKMIQNTDDPQFIEKFTNYIKSIPAGASSKVYLSKFFFDKENQKKLAPVLANQCKRMNKNMNEFLCSDLTELGSLDDNTSRNLFNKLNTTDSMEDQYDVDFSDASVLTAYGMQCLAKDNLANNLNNNESSDFQSIDQWYADFTHNTRDEASLSRGQTFVNDFCTIYTCNDKKTQSLNSCKNGGPLSSAELSKSLGCEETPRKIDCTSDLQKTISYMSSLEKLKHGSIDQVIASLSTSASKPSNNENPKNIVSGRLPNFAENYFGIEGSLKALGKPITAYEVSHKKQEFVENNLVSKTPPYSSPAAIKKELTRVQKNPKKEVTQDTSSLQPAYTPTAATHTAVTQQAFKMPIDQNKKASSKAKSNSQKIVTEDSVAENSRFREEMEKIIVEIKNTKLEIEGVQSTIESKYSTVKKVGSNSRETSSINRSEQERLKRLEYSLNEKSIRLEEYRKELDNRNFSTRAGLAVDRAPASFPTNNIPNNASNGASNTNDVSGNSSSGNLIKLSSTTNTKADPKTIGHNNAAAIIQSGVESSSLTEEELSKLSADNLANLGIDSSQPFTLKVSFEGQTYQVPVRSFTYKGAKALGPIMNPKNKNLNDFILRSPLFKHFVNFIYEKERRQKLSI